jgi:hypothetical protein
MPQTPTQATMDATSTSMQTTGNMPRTRNIRRAHLAWQKHEWQLNLKILIGSQQGLGARLRRVRDDVAHAQLRPCARART